METSEELYKQLGEWNVKAYECEKALNSLLPLQEGDGLPSVVITPEYIEKFKKTENELKAALDTVSTILEKIWKISS